MIWQKTLTIEMKLNLNQLKQFEFMQNLSPQTINRIMNEHSQVKLFKPGQKVMS